ncbi:MAG: ferritin-like domain-containing protein [Gaiellaceae bacterium]|jgi:rubrerythrin
MDEQRDFARFLHAVDVDAAIAEASHQRRLALSRRGLLAAAAAGAGALVLGRSEARAASGLSANDIGILNYALVLEYLQASFYTEAERSGALSGKTAQAATVVGATERAHVKAFQKLLGSKAVKRPLFDFQGVTEAQQAFLKTAVAFEDLAVAAYKGQAPKLRSSAVLAAAVGIHSVEARHAAWMRELFGVTPAVNAFDKPATKQNINRIVASTHFIVAHPKMKARSKPQYTG